MPSALQQAGLTPPAAPDNTPASALAGVPPASGVQAGPQAGPQPGPPQGQPGAPAQPIPAPSRQQTIAGLRHFAALEKPLEAALRDPDLGKSDMKDKVIDGMTGLVADRIMSPGEAVSQLSTFPDRPFDQKTWLLNHMKTIMAAREALLSHHAAASAGAPYEPPHDAEDHMQHMSSMMSGHYGQKPTVH